MSLINLANLDKYSSAFPVSCVWIKYWMAPNELNIKCGFICALSALSLSSAIFLLYFVFSSSRSLFFRMKNLLMKNANPIVKATMINVVHGIFLFTLIVRYLVSLTKLFVIVSMKDQVEFTGMDIELSFTEYSLLP